VRRPGAHEADLLRDVRLRALRDAPMAFGSTLAREEGYAPEKWERRAAESATGEGQAIFIAEPAAGMASGVIDGDGEPLGHSGAVVAVLERRLGQG
jgi:formylmethanofuran:tetrahydromethanopterin formyltransferase